MIAQGDRNLGKTTALLRKSSVEVVVDELRAWLLTGRLQPGERLTEMGLSAELGIGRSTVRTALLELEKDDLLVRSPYVGWAVPEITPELISEIYTLRGALEELAARMVAQSIDDAKRERLVEAFNVLDKAQNDANSDRPEADLNFHRTIVELSGHSRLITLYAALLHKMEWVYRWSENQSPGRIHLVDWHRPILDALVAGNAAAAEHAIRQNYSSALSDDLLDLKNKRNGP